MHNIQIYDMEFKDGRLVLYIDKENKPVNIKDCEKFTSSLRFLLQSENVKDMELEVSSPGLERKLKQQQHFQTAIGKKIKVHTYQPVIYTDNDKKHKTNTLRGRLKSCSKMNILVHDGTQDRKLNLKDIKTAHVVFEN